jgi:glutamate/tyrosine decarboxylase-like PLP-dependent enzyme
MALTRNVVTHNSVALDGPRFMALIPAAPSLTSKAFDAVVAAMSYSPESWIEGAGPVAAENQALRVLADSAGLPAGAGGCFVSGGSAGNLAALAVARDLGHGVGSAVLVSSAAHASVARAAHLLGLRVVDVAADDNGRLRGGAVEGALAEVSDVSAVVASAGTTNAGVIDELDAIADTCTAHDVWLHVDAAYGGGALLAPSVRDRFRGIGRADSIVIDPHKWLFCTLDCGALLYREPERAIPTFRQEASYLELLHTDGGWNPSDYAFHLTRRARGLPLWFSMVVHGLDAYADAIERVLQLTREAADLIRATPNVRLLNDPELSVLLFARDGWAESDYLGWARRLLDDGIAFVVPSRWRGEVVGRAVFLHPDTPLDLFRQVLAALA